ncbi:Crinkler (CRN), partial [Phytophthora megakarya]
IDENETVGDLKNAIKAQKPNGLKYVDADKLQLFLSKKGDGWLQSKELAMVQEEEAKTPMGFERVPMMDATWVIQDVLAEMPNPQSRQIHVLVVVPGHVRVNTEQDTNGGRSTVNASYLPYWWSLQSLFWPTERTHPTKKDV